MSIIPELEVTFDRQSISKKPIRILFMNNAFLRKINPTKHLVSNLVAQGHTVDYFIIDNFYRTQSELKNLREAIEETGANYTYLEIQKPHELTNIIHYVFGWLWYQNKNPNYNATIGSLFSCCSNRYSSRQQTIDIGKTIWEKWLKGEQVAIKLMEKYPKCNL